MLIDTHCHLTDRRFSDIGEVLKRAQEAGVERVIFPSTSVEDAKLAVEIAEKYQQYCLVGIHPENVEDLYGLSRSPRRPRNDDGMDSGSLAGMTDVVIGELEEIIKSSKRVVGIGEIGLDFFYDKEKKTKEKQIELFRRQMELAVENNLPVAIHMREAEEEMRDELDNFRRAHRDAPLRGQFHCFAGSEEFLEMILERGFYVSFCGNITYKTAGNLRELLRRVPLDRLLLETDSPYLAPEPLRGTVNIPANVKIIAEFVATELNLDLPKLAEITSQNTKCLYSLDI
ncbi:MAG: Hydrolase, TatD family [Candidatus Collierbacteria bacterium GW2011_GWB1_45_35]|uniref:Hydrolase, TatD family n=1 Tax=Candidatus Collierbacteria bacterium GW2011_GWB2_45_17 TaxID=1618388 RepID=A0A837IJ57_9BACT|nr:MAG: Hydrolase, TatD family [Microgenomates group bacterium GW2011_GWC1_44_23]KKT96018.1 MAG: Hydrolase, TatD family [Candidatus Collierbacteria bacterium GW2011_GWA1_45_15]KKU01109.1 MAG: Hydrolase, TatD family [Candidatus Collierbacteria bacterium GW2011_GWB2_45_17]KKU05721.1 MAG: Hydrolase, TatD family [Candidatus Collierbacteria bacterium GW2011_GWB1_45_35]KKU08079.1 MAG: Hydrolase, TatD family [Candidatus Collierbacteria bacterium GW2011_GWC2_45_40]HBC45145.1 hypothetical protein [Cand